MIQKDCSSLGPCKSVVNSFVLLDSFLVFVAVNSQFYVSETNRKATYKYKICTSVH